MNMKPSRILSLQIITSTLLALLAQTAVADPISMRRNGDGGWELVRDGKTFFVRGAGGQNHLDVLVESGGNAIRTWGIESLTEKVDGETLVERARKHDLVIAAGLWVGHERHGFDYSNDTQIKEQREAIRAAVAKWKGEPTIGFWGLGNEMEGPMSDGRDVRIWKELEELAKIIKKEDPTRLIMTVIAGAGAEKVKGMKDHCPSIDIIGVNAYASASGAGKAVKQAGWDKPFILSEFGPMGHWEVGKTEWGAPIEPSSREKAAKYYSAHQLVVEESEGLCVGSFAFVWGQKQETTSTWYGMFLKSGEKLPPVDAMAKAWTGEWPENRCPRVESFTSTAAQHSVSPGETVEVTLEARDPEGGELEFSWAIAGESTDRKHGGDAEAAPPEMPVKVEPSGANAWRFKAPGKPGEYRLFLVVRDGQQAASAENFPFRVR